MTQASQKQIKGNLSELEKSLETIIDIFHKHAARVGHYDTLTKGELKELIDKQLVNFLKNKRDPVPINILFKDLDENRDQQLSFGEFMVLVTRVTIVAHDDLHEGEGQQQQQGQHQH